MKSRFLALRGLAGCALIALGASAAPASELVELHSWFSPGRLDNVATTHPSWVGAPGQTRSPDYRFAGVEGRVLAADAGRLPGTVALHGWYSPGRGDNSTTSHPSWQGGPGATRSPDYGYSRLEGYAYDRPLAGTIPLVRWYDPNRGDNFSTTHPGWIPAGRTGDVRSPRYVNPRIDGWIEPAAGQLARGHDPALFGYGSRAATGTRPLLVVLLEFADVRLSQSDDFYARMVFGPAEPNLAGYFRALSQGRFAWQRAGVVRVRLPQNAPGATAPPGLNAQVMRAVAAQGFDFARFDTDRDGKVERHELGVLRLVSDYWPPYTAGGQNAGLPTITVGRVQLAGLESANCNEYGDLKLLAHELLHQLGISEHIYGPGRALNDDATPMASSDDQRAVGSGPVALDPFSAMALGWMRPRVVPITAAGGIASLAAAQHASASAAPVLFYDPNRSLKEFFVVEYRTPSTSLRPDGAYDAKVRRNGLAVWYVQRGADGKVIAFDWPPPPVRPTVGGDMFANYYIGPDGPGRGSFLNADDGEFALPWGDGSDSKLRLRMAPGNATATHAALQWRHADQPFLPRIDEIRPSEARAGATLVLDGVFPVTAPAADGLEVVIAGPGIGGGGRPVEIDSHGPARILVRLPDGLPDGDYLLTVRSEGNRPASGGNSVRVRVSARSS